MEIFLCFFILAYSFLQTANLMLLKLSCSTNSLSKSLIFAGLLFAGFKNLTKHYLKHALSPFLILINPFIGFHSSLGNEK